MGLVLDLALELVAGAVRCENRSWPRCYLALVGLATGAGDTPARIGSESAAEAVAQGQAAYALGRWDRGAGGV